MTNRSLFTDLSAYDYKWNLYVDEKKMAEGCLEVSGKPGETVTVSVPVTVELENNICCMGGKEAFLNLYAVLKEDTIWAEAGHVVAQGQFITGKKAGKCDIIYLLENMSLRPFPCYDKGLVGKQFGRFSKERNSFFL